MQDGRAAVAVGGLALQAMGADRLGLAVLSSDRIRKELAGWPAEASVPASYGSGIYSAEWTERVYAELLHRATVLLAHGESVVADASFISARHRVAATAAAAGVSADLVQLRCAASPEVAARRISTRTGGASDADQAIASQMAALADPWPDATVIDTEPGGTAGLPGGAAEQVLKVIRPQGAERVWRPSRPYMLPG